MPAARVTALAVTWDPASRTLRVRFQPAEDRVAEDVIAALTAAPTVRLLQELSQGPVRYRLHFDGYTGRGADETALRTRIIEGVRRRAPTLHNDPQASPWQIEIAWLRSATSLALATPGMPSMTGSMTFWA